MSKFLFASRTAMLVGLLASTATIAAHAQVTPPVAPLPPDPPSARTFYFAGGSGVSRAYLGITPRNAGGAGDTLGLLVDDVESDLPAAKAGITRGARLVSIDGIDLRVDPRDLGDYAGESLPESRLRRFLARKEPGDTVAIVVFTDGRTDTKRVVLAESRFASTMRTLSTGRRVLGVSFSQRGSLRDTAGLLVVSITSGGAADKAGLNEGDRIVSVDGVDLRVPAIDAGSSDGVDARVSRFRRALDAVRDSQAVRLDVLSDGRHRTVSVTPTRERGFTFNMPGMRGLVGLTGDVQSRTAVERFDRWPRERDVDDDTDGDGDGDGDHDRDMRVTGRIHGRTDGATLVLSGLSLASVDRDFAQQFGRGSESGALVVRVRGNWEPLKAGDVLVSVDGRSVRDGNILDVSFDRRRDQRLEILRNGKRETVTLKANR